VVHVSSPHARARILLTHVPGMRRTYYGDRAFAALAELGDVVTHEGVLPLEGAALADAAAGCRIVVADRNTPLAASVLARLPSVAAVLRVAVDIRNIDVAAASGEGILVCQASRTWVPAVAELVVGLMIDAARGIARANLAYKAMRDPEIRVGRQLRGSTAGLIGYGPLGRYVAELCLAFGMRVLVCDPYVAVDGASLRQVELRELLAEADFVLPLAVATQETENLIGQAALCAMKPSAFLVNLSRGNLIDEGALERALDEGAIAGAAMDVGRAADQMPSAVLARRPNVTATPHVGGLTQEAIEGQAMETVEQAAAILAGRLPTGAVNAAQARRITHPT
jgi:D-3-phosphoglycerate dehydrogenase / 2-oxoglutarate reductase